MIGFEPFGGRDGRLQSHRLKRRQNGMGDGLIDLCAADAQAVDAATGDDVLAWTMITRG